MAKYYRKITKKEVKDYAKIISEIENHDQFLELLGLEKVEKGNGKQPERPIWNLRKRRRFKGYNDTWCRSRVGHILDELKEKHGFDFLEYRRQVISGATVYVNERHWEMLMARLRKLKPEHTHFILSGMDMTRDRSLSGTIKLALSVGKGIK